jgi:hypothetical protein
MQGFSLGSGGQIPSNISLLWSLTGANMNTTNDQALTKAFGFTNHIITSVFFTNASVSLTTATASLYTAAAAGGTQIMNAQVLTTLSSATAILQVLLASLASTVLRTNTVMYLHNTLGQGSAATVDLYVYGIALS